MPEEVNMCPFYCAFVYAAIFGIHHLHRWWTTKKRIAPPPTTKTAFQWMKGKVWDNQERRWMVGLSAYLRVMAYVHAALTLYYFDYYCWVQGYGLQDFVNLATPWPTAHKMIETALPVVQGMASGMTFPPWVLGLLSSSRVLLRNKVLIETIMWSAPFSLCSTVLCRFLRDKLLARTKPVDQQERVLPFNSSVFHTDKGPQVFVQCGDLQFPAADAALHGMAVTFAADGELLTVSRLSTPPNHTSTMLSEGMVMSSAPKPTTMDTHELVFGINVLGVIHNHSTVCRLKHSSKALFKSAIAATNHGMQGLLKARFEDLYVRTAHTRGDWLPLNSVFRHGIFGSNTVTKWVDTAIDFADTDYDPAFIREEFTAKDIILLDESYLDMAMTGLKMKKFIPERNKDAAIAINSRATTGADWRAEGRMKVDDTEARLYGTVRHALSTQAGTSGSPAWNIASPSSLAMIHIAGPEDPRHPLVGSHPNLGVSGVAVEQLFYKLHGKSYTPEWKISANSPHFDEIFNDRAGANFDDLWRQCVFEEQLRKADGLPDHSEPLPPLTSVSEAVLSQHLWRKVVRRLQRKGVKKDRAQSYLYAKVSNTIPRFDPTMTADERKEEQERLDAIWREEELEASIQEEISGYSGKENYNRKSRGHQDTKYLQPGTWGAESAEAEGTKRDVFRMPENPPTTVTATSEAYVAPGVSTTERPAPVFQEPDQWRAGMNSFAKGPDGRLLPSSNLNDVHEVPIRALPSDVSGLRHNLLTSGIPDQLDPELNGLGAVLDYECTIPLTKEQKKAIVAIRHQAKVKAEMAAKAFKKAARDAEIAARSPVVPETEAVLRQPKFLYYGNADGSISLYTGKLDIPMQGECFQQTYNYLSNCFRNWYTPTCAEESLVCLEDDDDYDFVCTIPAPPKVKTKKNIYAFSKDKWKTRKRQHKIIKTKAIALADCDLAYTSESAPTSAPPGIPVPWVPTLQALPESSSVEACIKSIHARMASETNLSAPQCNPNCTCKRCVKFKALIEKVPPSLKAEYIRRAYPNCPLPAYKSQSFDGKPPPVSKFLINQMKDYDEMFENFERPVPTDSHQLKGCGVKVPHCTSDQLDKFDALFHETMLHLHDGSPFSDVLRDVQAFIVDYNDPLSFDPCVSQSKGKHQWRKVCASLNGSQTFQKYIAMNIPHLMHDDRLPNPQLNNLGRVAFGAGGKDAKSSEPGVEHHPMLEKLNCMEDDPAIPGGRRTKGVWPATGPKAAKASLAFQMDRKDAHRCTIVHNKEHLLEYTNGHPAPLFEDVATSKHSSEYTFKDRLESAFKGLDASKGPGWSQQYGCMTKGEFVELPNKAEICVATLLLYLVYDPTWLSTLNSVQLFRLGLLDPEGLKVKKEVHGRAKADKQRWRLIFLGSARLEVIHRLLHGPQNAIEKALYEEGHTHHPSTPTFGSCVGMGHDDDNIAKTIAAMKRLNLQEGGQCQDASSFDMLLAASTLYCDGWRRALLSLQGGALSPFADAQMVIAVVMSRHIFHIGMELYANAQLGTLGSGLFSTTASNSFLRGLLYSAAFWDDFSEEEKATIQSLLMGDDLAGTMLALARHYTRWAAMGLLLNEEDEDPIIPLSSVDRNEYMVFEDNGYGAEVLTDERAVVYFTSHRYDLKDGTCTYHNMPKLLLRLTFVGLAGLSVEQLGGVLHCVRNHPGQVQQIIKLAQTLVSKGLLEAGVLEAAINLDPEYCSMDGII